MPNNDQIAKPKRGRPPLKTNSAEVAALNDILNLLNNPEIPGREATKPEDVITAAGTETMFTSAPPGPEKVGGAISFPEPAPVKKTPPLVEFSEDTPPVVKPAIQKLFFTGRLKSGKDSCATAAGARVLGFADPLYAIASHYFGVTVNATEGKDIPGIRTFLQIIGQWGRGVVSESYPLTVPRALFTQQIRNDGAAGYFGEPSECGVDNLWKIFWPHYGRDEAIWLNSCIARAEDYLISDPKARIAITNCRFSNEFQALQSAGWTHWHCVCSPATWSQRLLQSNLTPESPALKDVSEQLAIGFDGNVIKQISAHKDGPMLRCVWTDDQTPKPSARLHSVQSFLQLL